MKTLPKIASISVHILEVTLNSNDFQKVYFTFTLSFRIIFKAAYKYHVVFHKIKSHL